MGHVSCPSHKVRACGLATYELVFLAADVGDIHVVGGWAEIFHLLAGEDVDGDQMDLGVTVLAGLGGGHFNNLAGAALDHNEAVLAQGRALHWVRGRGTGIGALEGVLMLWRAMSVMWCCTRYRSGEDGEVGGEVRR